jgi:hypothetical protein
VAAARPVQERQWDIGPAFGDHKAELDAVWGAWDEAEAKGKDGAHWAEGEAKGKDGTRWAEGQRKGDTGTKIIETGDKKFAAWRRNEANVERQMDSGPALPDIYGEGARLKAEYGDAEGDARWAEDKAQKNAVAKVIGDAGQPGASIVLRANVERQMDAGPALPDIYGEGERLKAEYGAAEGDARWSHAQAQKNAVATVIGSAGQTGESIVSRRDVAAMQAQIDRLAAQLEEFRSAQR